MMVPSDQCSSLCVVEGGRRRAGSYVPPCPAIVFSPSKNDRRVRTWTPPHMMVRVGGRDGHRKVDTHPPGATGLHFPVRIERRARYVAVEVTGLLLEESLLVWMRVRHPILKDVIDRGRDCGRTCASSPFNDGCWVTRSIHLHQRHIRSSRREISPPPCS